MHRGNPANPRHAQLASTSQRAVTCGRRRIGAAGDGRTWMPLRVVVATVSDAPLQSRAFMIVEIDQMLLVGAMIDSDREDVA